MHTERDWAPMSDPRSEQAVQEHEQDEGGDADVAPIPLNSECKRCKRYSCDRRGNQEQQAQLDNSTTSKGKCGAHNSHPMPKIRWFSNEDLVGRAGKSVAD